MLITCFNSNHVNIISAKSIKHQAVEWLWYLITPFSKIMLVQGGPYDGKSTIALTLVALFARGHPMIFVDTTV